MKTFTGKVVSTKMSKTATVVVERFFEHPIYKKRIRKAKKYHVHDEIGAKVGDEVNFVDSRPYSKTKRWRLVEILGETKKKETKKSKQK